MAESIRVMCPNLTCRRVLAIPQNARGKTVRCKNCGTNIKVPAAGGIHSGSGQAQAPAKD